ncbi:MAG: DUF1232 domain-containing protein, partial [Thermogutta sp.]|uniref:YkvA family protein n=1 Tax=Thermogutta sp. TaxID=1962930 RepID=UPI001995D801
LANTAAIERKASFGALRQFAAIIPNLISMISDFLCGRYTKVPWATIAMSSAALLYVLTPLDACPDVIPVAGLLDDAAVLSFVWAAVKSGVETYLRWKAETAKTERN